MTLKMLIGHQCTFSHSISDSLQAFNRILTEFFDRDTPFATKRTSTNISPWLTEELRNKMDYRDVLQRKSKTSRKQPRTTRNTNVRETKLITRLKEPNKTTTKTC